MWSRHWSRYGVSQNYREHAAVTGALDERQEVPF